MQKGPASPSGETGTLEQTCHSDQRTLVAGCAPTQHRPTCDTMNYLALACEDYEDLL